MNKTGQTGPYGTTSDVKEDLEDNHEESVKRDGCEGHGDKVRTS